MAEVNNEKALADALAMLFSTCLTVMHGKSKPGELEESMQLALATLRSTGHWDRVRGKGKPHVG